MSATKTWFITGCSSGFGRALAEAALAAGHRVIATARDLRRIADLERLETCRLLPLDLTDAATIRHAVAEAGRFDVLVNNAGSGLLGAAEECADDQIRRNMETNFFGPLNLIRASLPMFRDQKCGHIINFSAAAAISNYPGFGIYGGAKAALEFVSESLRLELAPLGIRVTIVEPGPFRTDFISRSLESARERLPDYDTTSGAFRRLVESMNGRQPGDPARAAEAILALVNSESPPLRLALGRYAIKKTRDKAAALLRDAEASERIAGNLDFPR
ncbi:MAG: oxidoreductase [Verrucomicrobiales bacterium]